MPVPVSIASKVALAVVLFGGIVLSARPGASRGPLSVRELHRLVLSALFLYAVGALAWLDHQLGLALMLYAGGIVTAALAVWLSRGHDFGAPEDRGDPVGERPGLDEPDRVFDWPALDWPALDVDYAERKPGAGISR